MREKIMLTDVFALELGPVEMVLRGTLVYWFFFLSTRIVGRRQLSSISVADFLILFLVADAAGDALTGGSESLTDGLIVVSTIIFWGAVIDRLSYHFPKMERFFTPERHQITKDGALQRRILRRHYIALDELTSEMRLKGIESLADVGNAYVEPSGEISFFEVKKQ